jgi:hypothetical protein
MGPRLRGDDSGESLLHIFESGDPYVDGPLLARAFAAVRVRIACDHMSGLLLRSPMTAGPDGVRDASSKQGRGFERAAGSHGVSRVLGSIDHTICSVSSKLSGLRDR